MDGVTAGNGLASDLHPGAHRTRRPSTSLERWRYCVVGRCSPRPGRDFSDIGALPFPKMHYVEPDWLFTEMAIRLVQCWPAAPLSQYMQTENTRRKKFMSIHARRQETSHRLSGRARQVTASREDLCFREIPSGEDPSVECEDWQAPHLCFCLAVKPLAVSTGWKRGRTRTRDAA